MKAPQRACLRCGKIHWGTCAPTIDEAVTRARKAVERHPDIPSARATLKGIEQLRDREAAAPSTKPAPKPEPLVPLLAREGDCASCDRRRALSKAAKRRGRTPPVGIR